jgi:hypothetical protein
MTFWEQIDHQLDRIVSDRPDTFDGVRAILLDTRYDEIQRDRNLNGLREFNPDAAFFAGSGGEATLRDSLRDAGWVVTWSKASYCYGMRHHATGETLTYIEGDVLRGDAR